MVSRDTHISSDLSDLDLSLISSLSDLDKTVERGDAMLLTYYIMVYNR